MPPDQLRGLIIGLYFFGGLMILIGLVVYAKTRRSARGMVRTEGKVVANEEREDTDGSGFIYSPIVSFTAVDGREYSFVDAVSSNPPLYDVGTSVRLLYSRADPSKAHLAGSLKVYIVPVIMVLVGAAIVAVGWWMG